MTAAPTAHAPVYTTVTGLNIDLSDLSPAEWELLQHYYERFLERPHSGDFLLEAARVARDATMLRSKAFIVAKDLARVLQISQHEGDERHLPTLGEQIYAAILNRHDSVASFCVKHGIEMRYVDAISRAKTIAALPPAAAFELTKICRALDIALTIVPTERMTRSSGADNVRTMFETMGR